MQKSYQHVKLYFPSPSLKSFWPRLHVKIVKTIFIEKTRHYLSYSSYFSSFSNPAATHFHYFIGSSKVPLMSWPKTHKLPKFYHCKGFVATCALGHITYSYKLLVLINQKTKRAQQAKQQAFAMDHFQSVLLCSIFLTLMVQCYQQCETKHHVNEGMSCHQVLLITFVKTLKTDLNRWPLSSYSNTLH